MGKNARLKGERQTSERSLRFGVFYQYSSARSLSYIIFLLSRNSVGDKDKVFVTSYKTSENVKVETPTEPGTASLKRMRFNVNDTSTQEAGSKGILEYKVVAHTVRND